MKKSSTLQKESKLTFEELKTRLQYNPETGEFIWLAGWVDKRGRSYNHKIGERAGANSGRYHGIQINGISYGSHRLAWFYMTGHWPTQLIDHIDGNGFNNKWSNLREATAQQNVMNTKTPRNNKAGVKGVRLCPKYNKWIVTIMKDNKRIYVGNYPTLEEAKNARKQAGKILHGEFFEQNR